MSETWSKVSSRKGSRPTSISQITSAAVSRLRSIPRAPGRLLRPHPTSRVLSDVLSVNRHNVAGTTPASLTAWRPKQATRRLDSHSGWPVVVSLRRAHTTHGTANATATPRRLRSVLCSMPFEAGRRTYCCTRTLFPTERFVGRFCPTHRRAVSRPRNRRSHPSGCREDTKSPTPRSRLRTSRFASGCPYPKAIP